MRPIQHARSRNAWVALTAATSIAAVGALQSAPAALGATANVAGAQAAGAGEPYLVGRGIADITGEAAEAGMLGYADFSQSTSGIHMRQRSRAFVIADPTSGRRVVHVVADTGMIFQSIRDGVLAKLRERYGDSYGEANVMLTATHTHAGPGGTSHHSLYNITTLGFRGKTYDAAVEGIVASIVRADADLAPAQLKVSTGELTNANVNRSKDAFDRNPAADKAHFPEGKDTRTTTLQVIRGGKLDGVINWFPVHATSMSTGNTLISPDNKGYAQYAWERRDKGVDYITDTDPSFIASFAQTNAGDMSPNLNLKPSDGPTTNEFDNMRILGERQLAGAKSSMLQPTRTLKSGVDSRITYVDLSDVSVRPEFTPDGTPQRTCDAALGASFAAGSTEDGGGGLPIFKEGKDGGNPVVDIISQGLYTVSPDLKACQSPKEILLPVGTLDLVQQKLPVQLTRIGDLYLVGVPAEVTVVAGLRLRQTVAKAIGTTIDKVLVQGYANAYAHYLTTPEEYDSRQYEGASTLFGRNELPAFMQVGAGLATAMRNGSDVPLGAKEADRSSGQWSSPSGAVVTDIPQLFRSFGDVLTQPNASYRPGTQATAVFAGAHPNNNLHTGGTFMSIERLEGSTWRRVADDGDWSTKFRWTRDGLAASKATITWDIPGGTPPGSYRIRYFGDSKSLLGQITPFEGSSRLFTVLP